MKTTLALALALLAAPALAQDAPAPGPAPEADPELTPVRTPEAGPPPRSTQQAFTPSHGCTAYLTVQMAACTVSHHFRCERDPEGWQRRVDMDEAGISYFGAIDAETQWVESLHLRAGRSESLGASPDPASFTELLETGRDSFDFVTESAEAGQTRFVGEDRLTGEQVTIDGVTLDRTEYEIVATTSDGAEAWRGSGSEYISRDWRMFLSGSSTYESDGQSSESDDRPVEFARPGEEGFLRATPKYGCGAVMSSWDAP